MKHAHISTEVQEFWFAANNCAPGCGCDDDRFDMSSTRVDDWKKSVDPAKRSLVLEELRQLASPANDSVLCEILSNFTNIAFRDGSFAKNWVRVWVQLLESQSKSGEDPKLNDWLSEHRFERPDEARNSKDLPEINICYSGILESSVDGREWRKIGSPSKGFKPFEIFYRYVGDPTIDDWDLISLAQLSFYPGLVDLRLNDCNALTDEAIGIIANVKSLQVLSIGSLQITGKTISGLRDLPNLQRLDLSGCANLVLPDGGINLPGCAIYRAESLS